MAGHPDALSSIGMALGHRDDPRAIEPLVALRDHPELACGLWPGPRFLVALGMTMGLADEPRRAAKGKLVPPVARRRVSGAAVGVR